MPWCRPWRGRLHRETRSNNTPTFQQLVSSQLYSWLQACRPTSGRLFTPIYESFRCCSWQTFDGPWCQSPNRGIVYNGHQRCEECSNGSFIEQGRFIHNVATYKMFSGVVRIHTCISHCVASVLTWNITGASLFATANEFLETKALYWLHVNTLLVIPVKHYLMISRYAITCGCCSL